ncbi:MAG: Fic family protein [Ilumatobacteraceae bacterium]
MWRVTPTSWRPEANPFEHPPATAVEALMAEAVDTANDADRPAIVRAAWLTFTALSIHPFVDGNGRTARALALGVSSEALELGVDWGLAEQWSVARRAYVEMLQAGQRASSYGGRQLDASPFVAFSAEASTVGARLCLCRVQTLDLEFERLTDAGLSAQAALLMLSVRCARFVDPDDLDALGLDSSAADRAVAELVDRSMIEWRQRPPSRTEIRRSAHGLAATHG